MGGCAVKIGFADIVSLTAPYLRVGMSQLLGLMMVIPWMGLLLKRRRKLWLLIMDICYVLFVMNWLMNGILGQYFRGELWWRLLYGFMAFMNPLINMAVFYYTYEGEFLKTTLASVIVDLIAGVHVIFCMVVVNILEGRENVFQSAGEFWPADLLVFAVWGISSALLMYLFGGFFKKFRTYQIKHKYIWGILLAAYFIIGILGRGVEVTSEDETLWIYMFQGYIGLALICIFTVLIFRLYTRSVAQRNDYLRAKGRLMKSHYIILQQQIRHIERSRAKNNEKMERILRMQEEWQGEELEEYVKDLRKQYEDISAGTYCSNWAVDALLCNLASSCRLRGLVPDFHFQSYEEGEIREEDMIPLLGNLGETAIRACEGGAVKLRGAAVQNQLVLTCSFRSEKKVSGKDYRELLKKYHGSFQSSVRGNMQTVTIALQREGIMD